MKSLFKLGLAIALLGAVGVAQAGHLFSQGTPTNLNAPVTLSAGSTLGVQPSQPPSTAGGIRLDIYGSSFDAGDQLRVQWGNGANDSILMTVGGAGCSTGTTLFRCSSLLSSMSAVLSSFTAALTSNGPIALTTTNGSLVVSGLVFTSSAQWQGRLINQVNATFASVSEPTTLAVLGLGLVGVAVSGLRRRREGGAAA